MVIFGQKLGFFKNISFFLNPLAGGHFENNTKNWAFFIPHRPSNENRICSWLLRTPPHHVIYQHDRKNLEIMIVDEIFAFGLDFKAIFAFFQAQNTYFALKIINQVQEIMWPIGPFNLLVSTKKPPFCVKFYYESYAINQNTLSLLVFFNNSRFSTPLI